MIFLESRYSNIELTPPRKEPTLKRLNDEGRSNSQTAKQPTADVSGEMQTSKLKSQTSNFNSNSNSTSTSTSDVDIDHLTPFSWRKRAPHPEKPSAR